MHRETLRQYEMMISKNGPAYVLENLACPHQFHLSYQIFEVAKEVMVAEATFARAHRSGQMLFPSTARLPAERLVVTIDRPERGLVQGGVYLLQRSGNEVVAFVVQEGEAAHLGGYYPGMETYSRAASGEGKWQWLLHLAFMVSLINEPRIVEAKPATGLEFSRPHRKAVERVTGKAAMAFSVVSWKIGKAVQAKSVPLTEEGHPKALHWCRAHWRHAAEGQPKAEWVNIPRKGGWGWYCWASDCWKGHPDFGIKLQRHEPTIGDEPRSRYLGGETVLDSTRLAAMGAAQRAALVEAGFAPSSALH